MSEMVDRVALAAKKYLHNRADLGAPINYEDLARAVMEEQREPTVEMIAAPDKAQPGFAFRLTARLVWRAMVGAALK